MKFRSDFVTNSSSSNFILTITIDYDGGSIKYTETGYCFECREYGKKLCCNISPKELGNAKDIDELINLIDNGVYFYVDEFENKYGDDDGDEYGIFNTSEISDKISSIYQIRRITISGELDNGFKQVFTYYPKSGKYVGHGDTELYDDSTGGELNIGTKECDYSHYSYYENGYRYCDDAYDAYDEYDIDENGIVSLPNGMTSIGDRAFEDCASLTSVTIPDSVTSIGDRAFYGCTSLTSVTIPDSVTSIGSCAFYGCTSLANKDGFVIVKNVLYFYHGKNPQIIIPDGVTSIGDRAFYGCTSLTSITIPASVTSIGSCAFHGCASLANKDGFVIVKNVLYCYHGKNPQIIIPDGVTSIGDRAFYGCTSLTSVTIPDSVTSIGDKAFDGCVHLTSITIPDSVTSIGDSAFDGCVHLTSITIPDSVTSIGDSAFENCTRLTSITIPDSVTSIGDSALKDCTRLTSVTIYGCTFDKSQYGKYTKEIEIEEEDIDIDNLVFAEYDDDYDKEDEYGYPSHYYKITFYPYLEVIDMLIKKKYRTSYMSGIPDSKRYEIVTQIFLKSSQPEAEKYIKDNIDEILLYWIEENNYETVKALVECGKFVTRENIQKIVAKCAKNGNNEQIKAYLKEYKNKIN